MSIATKSRKSTKENIIPFVLFRLIILHLDGVDLGEKRLHFVGRAVACEFTNKRRIEEIRIEILDHASLLCMFYITEYFDEHVVYRSACDARFLSGPLDYGLYDTRLFYMKWSFGAKEHRERICHK
jgi:hypothetical protein